MLQRSGKFKIVFVRVLEMGMKMQDAGIML